MDLNSWLMLLGRVFSFIFIAFMGFYFLGNGGWLVLVFVLAAAVTWWRSEQRGYQCPQCKHYFAREYLNVQIMEKGGWIRGGKTEFTYKCQRCGHEWKQIVTTSSVLTSFLNG